MAVLWRYYGSTVAYWHKIPTTYQILSCDMEDTSTSISLSDSLKYFWTGLRASSKYACRRFVAAESASSFTPSEK